MPVMKDVLRLALACGAATLLVVSTPRGTAQSILREYFLDLPGSTIPDLTNAPSFPFSPSGASYPTLFEAPADWAENYGTRMRGYVTAPQAGDYTFWIASDDQSELYLSTDDTALGKALIARVPTWTGSRVWEEPRDNNIAYQKSAPIGLQAGQRYYIEALQKEGGGGDNLAVGWQLPDGTYERPIPGARLAPWVTSTNAPSIVAQPTNLTVYVGAPARFRVTASGLEPFTYQWQREGADLGGATNQVFLLPVSTWTDHGAGFRCVVRNARGSATSEVAVLTVLADAVAPTLAAVSPAPGARLTHFEQVTVTFTEPVFGLDVADLLINGGAFATNMTGGGAGPYAFLFHPPSEPGAFVVSWAADHGIVDYSTNAFAGSNWSYTLDLSGPSGIIRREYFLLSSGGTIASLLASPNYPHSPSGVSFETLFEGPSGWADHYGTRMRGYVHPPQTGDYTFYIATDDQGELYLSSDESSANKTLIASMPTWVGSRDWENTRDPANAAQKSAPIRLEAGRRYYVEALQSEGGGGDNIAVAWKLPDGTLEGPIPGSRLSHFQTSTNPPGFTTDLADVTAAEHETVTLRVTVVGAEPLSFFWWRDGRPLEGVGSGVLVLPNVQTNDSGAVFHCVVTNAFGSVTSRLATLSVEPERVPPVLVELLPAAGRAVRHLAQVEALFSEPVSGVEAADLLVNGQPATNLLGALAGPYVFQFAPPPHGWVQFAWAPDHGIADWSAHRNPFAGGAWSNLLDPAAPLGGLVINELLAANENGLADEEGEPQDWIELFNAGPEPVDLAGWSLSDDPGHPGQWVFPPRTLPAGGYLVVFASGKDRRDGTPLHTSFRLSAGGEYLGLFAPESPRLPVSELTPRYPEQRNDHSYGLDAGGQWRYFRTPTPGASNGVSTIVGVVEPVHFSVPRGLFGSPFNVLLNTPTPGASIYYTTNGSEPTETTGLLYTGPLRLTGTTMLRAAGFKTNWLPSAVGTHTYFFNLTAAQRSLPVLSLVTASNHLYGPSGILGISGGTYTNGPWQPLTTNDYHNPSKRGRAWERPASAELIRPADNGGFQIDCGLRVGGGDWIRPQLRPDSKFTFHLYFRGDYGPGKLEYPFFPGAPVTAFDEILIRAGMNDPVNPFVRDDLARRLLADTGQVSSHGTFVNLFVNGQYRGYYNPTERIEKHFCQAWHGGGEDWDVLQQGSVPVDGDAVAWNSLRGFVAGQDVTQPSVYLEIERRFDLVNFADYLLVNAYAGTGDWGWNNWRAARERVPGARFRYYIWDAEWAWGIAGPPDRNVFAGELAGGSELADLYQKLRLSPEFRLLCADRIQRHFFNHGALTDTNAWRRHAELRTNVSGVIPGYDNSIETVWIRHRRTNVFAHFAGQGLLAPLAAPVFSPHGGRVAPGFNLILTAPVGTLYLTTNGADPRLRFSGAVAPEAVAHLSGAPLRLDQGLLLRARAFDGTNWSTLAEAEFTVGRLGLPLRITEIMYHPVGGDAYEFIELHNGGGAPMDLGGFTLVGVEFRFPHGATLAPGATLVLCSDAAPAAFAARYPEVTVYGTFTGRLDNGGERLAVRDAAGNLVVSVDYDDTGGWPLAADGGGPSLTLLHPDGDPDDPANWIASPTPGGSPGIIENPPATVPAVRLNELMAHNVAAVANGTNFPDWLELFNASTQAADLAGWSLTDDSNPRKFVFPPGTLLEAGGLLVVWCDSDHAAPGLHTGFALSREGESVFLFDARTNGVDTLGYGLQVADLSIGRVGEAGTWQLTQPTPGAANVAAALASPTNVVLNEWLANPLPGADDWIELYNRDTNRPADLGGWYLGNGAASARLRPLSFIGAGGFCLLHADEQPGVDHLDFRLPATGSLIALYDESATLRDAVTNVAQVEGTSIGRVPDGGATMLQLGNRATPGAPNVATTYSGPRFNEFMARNVTAVNDGAGRFVDWLELYFAGTTPFDLSGMSLSVNERQPGQWVFPAGVTLQGYLVLWCDPDRPPSLAPGSLLNVGRELGDASGGLYLFDRADRLVDQVEYGFQVQDASLGRILGSWRLTAAPTPGASNAAAASLGSPTSLRVNEWMASPRTGDDWFEIYNTNTQPVSLNGVFLADDPSLAGQTNFAVNALSFIGPQSWMLWQADGDAAAGRNHVNFRLNAAGESLRIYQGGALLDAVDFGPQAPGVSQGRLPDGSSDIVSFPTTPTPGSMNLADTDGDGLPDEWELAHGLNRSDPSDRTEDPDGDGLSNHGEYLAGTDPRDPGSCLRVEAAPDGGGSLRLSFTAVAGRSYSLLCRDAFGLLPWSRCRDFPARPATRRVEWSESVSIPSARYYLLAMPGP
jgi:hypothetical protein